MKLVLSSVLVVMIALLPVSAAAQHRARLPAW